MCAAARSCRPATTNCRLQDLTCYIYGPRAVRKRNVDDHQFGIKSLVGNQVLHYWQMPLHVQLERLQTVSLPPNIELGCRAIIRLCDEPFDLLDPVPSNLGTSGEVKIIHY